MILHGGGGDTETACWYLKTSSSLVPGESQEPQVEVRRNKTGKKGMTARACVCESTRAGNCQGVGRPTEHTSEGAVLIAPECLPTPAHVTARQQVCAHPASRAPELPSEWD